MTQIAGYLFLGLTAGVLSGLFGIGGGVVIIPALIFFFGMSQHMAQGTTLALFVPPIGILAVWTYYQQGDVNLKAAALICAGFLLGGLIGAKWAVNIPEVLLKRIFGGLLFIIAFKLVFGK